MLSPSYNIAPRQQTAVAVSFVPALPVAAHHLREMSIELRSVAERDLFID